MPARARQPADRGAAPRLPTLAPGMKIGLFGGSFNPPHKAHRAASLLAMKRLGLDRVWWLVSPGNPLKDTRALPPLAEEWATNIGLGGLVPPSGDWPGIGQEMQRLKFLIFGAILVLTMLLRPQGLIPSRVRQQELTKGVHEDQTIEDVNAETTA